MIKFFKVKMITPFAANLDGKLLSPIYIEATEVKCEAQAKLNWIKNLSSVVILLFSISLLTAWLIGMISSYEFVVIGTVVAFVIGVSVFDGEFHIPFAFSLALTGLFAATGSGGVAATIAGGVAFVYATSGAIDYFSRRISEAEVRLVKISELKAKKKLS